MSTRHPEIFNALCAGFHAGEVKTRPQGGRSIPYVTARTVMNRLDSALGPENWWDAYAAAGEHSVLCRLTIRLPDGSTVTKEDAGGAAGMADSGDDDKSAHSDAFKRAAVKFGVGRYLYGDGVPAFEEPSESVSEAVGVDSDGSPTPAPSPAAPPTPRLPNRVNGKPHDGPPRSGRALFAWTKDQEQTHDVGLLKHLNTWAKLNDLPGRMVDWDAETVERAYSEACRKLAAARSREREHAS